MTTTEAPSRETVQQVLAFLASQDAILNRVARIAGAEAGDWTRGYLRRLLAAFAEAVRS